MALTPKQAEQALKLYRDGLPAAFARGLRRGVRKARAKVLTEYMVRKDSRHPKVWDPPNPAPGPLAIRRGSLARTVRLTTQIINRLRVSDGLEAGSSRVQYARIHELGGKTSAHTITARRGPVLTFKGKDGTFVSKRSVNHPGSKIDARPYLRPALEAQTDAIEDDVRLEMVKLARATLKGLIKRAS